MTQIKKPKKLDAIYQATLKLTGVVGIAGLKMSDIASEAAMAIGNLYVYFDSKEDLLNALYLKLKKQDQIRLALSVEGIPVKVMLFNLWETMLVKMTANPNKTIFMEQFSASAIATKESREADDEYLQYVEGILDRGKEEMIIKPLDNKVLVSMINGFMKDYSLLLASNKIQVSKQVVRKSFSVCWDAIKD